MRSGETTGTNVGGGPGLGTPAAGLSPSSPYVACMKNGYA